MTYDDWKATDDTPEPEDPRCPHLFMPDENCPECDGLPVYECDKCGAQAGEIMVKSGYCGGPCDCGGNVRENR